MWISDGSIHSNPFTNHQSTNQSNGNDAEKSIFSQTTSTLQIMEKKVNSITTMLNLKRIASLERMGWEEEGKGVTGVAPMGHGSEW